MRVPAIWSPRTGRQCDTHLPALWSPLRSAPNTLPDVGTNHSVWALFFFLFVFILSFLNSLYLLPTSLSIQPLESLCRPLPVPSLSGLLSGRTPGSCILAPQLRALQVGAAPRAPPEAQLLPACVFAGRCHQRGRRKRFLWNGWLWTCWSRTGLTQHGDNRMVVPLQPHTGEIKPNKSVRTDACTHSGVPNKGILMDPLGRARTEWQWAP